MKIAPFGFVLGGLRGLTGVRIAHLIETDGPGGAERMLSLLAAELQRGGCPGAAFPPARREGGVEAELTSAGVTGEDVPPNRPVSPRLPPDPAAPVRPPRLRLGPRHRV